MEKYKGQSNKTLTPAIKTHSSQKLTTLLRIDTAICSVGDMHCENAQVRTVVSLLLWRWTWCKVCSSSTENGGNKRRAERCGSFLVAEGAGTREIHCRMSVGEHCMFLTSLYEWQKRFGEGRTSLQDDSCPGQAHRVITPDCWPDLGKPTNHRGTNSCSGRH